MTCYQLAFMYITRKKAKSILLLLVLIFISGMILITNMILKASQDASASIQEKAGSKVVAQILREDNRITNSDIEQVNQIYDVTSINRLSKHTSSPVNFNVITNSDTREEENARVTLLSYDDLEKDSAFSDGTYRLLSGSLINKENKTGIVINSLLAEMNGLEIDDELVFDSKDENKVAVKIIGIYLSGSERKQPSSLTSINRIENQMFIDNETYAKLFGNDGYYSIAVYTKSPEQLEDLKITLENLFENKFELTTSDALFQQMVAPLNQIIRITSLIRILTLITGFVIISLLLCMWMRTRQKEIAIFISLGKTKTSILFQVFLETATIFFIAVLTASIVGVFMAKFLPSILSNVETNGTAINIVFNMRDVTSLLCLGGGIILPAVGCSLLPIIRANPKATLSRMEG